MTMRHLRQLGLLNQPRLAQLKVLVSGQADEVADVVVLLDQLGAAQSGGSIGVQLIGEDMPSAVFWKLAFPEHGQIDSLVKARPDLYTMVSSDQPSEEWDIHLSFSDTAQPITTTVYGAVSGPRAAVSMTPLTPPHAIDESTAHPLGPALRVVCVAAMVERMLDEMELRNAVPISDAWVTITCRIETTDEEEARAKVSSSGGMPVSMTPTADGLATLARIRLPYPFHSTRTNTLRCEPTATRICQNWSTSVSSPGTPLLTPSTFRLPSNPRTWSCLVSVVSGVGAHLC